MATIQDVTLDRLFYEESAREYCSSLPLEHFMESMPQSTQRKITLESFDLIHAERPDIWCYNELLIQYPKGEIRDIARVVPDNLIVIHDAELHGTGSFNTPFEEAAPFMAMEYVSASNRRKDYVENMNRYRELGMKYYLLFDAEPQRPKGRELTLYRLTEKGRFIGEKANAAGRLEVPDLDLEMALMDDWVRFWFKGKLVPLPVDLAQEVSRLSGDLRDTKRKLRVANEEVRAAKEARETAEAEITRLKAELEKRGGS